MTSFAFILGVHAALLRNWSRPIGRHSVGTAIVGGMLFSTILNLLFIPVLYVIVKGLLPSKPSGSERGVENSRAMEPSDV